MPATGSRGRAIISLEADEVKVPAAAAILSMSERSVIGLLKEGKLDGRRNTLHSKTGHWIVKLDSIYDYKRVTLPDAAAELEAVRRLAGTATGWRLSVPLGNYLTTKYGRKLVREQIAEIDGTAVLSNGGGRVWISYFGRTGKTCLAQYARIDKDGEDVAGNHKFFIKVMATMNAYIFYDPRRGETFEESCAIIDKIISRAISAARHDAQEHQKRSSKG